ncbi:MAG: hypothetical protein R6V85_11465 [Polyangia bacterium]
MRKTKQILRLKLGEKRSLREVAQSVGMSPSVIHDCVVRFEAAGLKWPLDPELDDGELEARLYHPEGAPTRQKKAELDLAHIHKELRRKGVTLYLLWQEYKQAHPDDGYQYSRFADRYREYRKRLDESRLEL